MTKVENHNSIANLSKCIKDVIHKCNTPYTKRYLKMHFEFMDHDIVKYEMIH